VQKSPPPIPIINLPKMLAMYRCIYILFLFVFPFLGKGQDIIFLKDGQQIESKIVAIEQDLVRYSYFYLKDNQIYSVEKSKVLRIEYQDGRIEKFQMTPPATDFPQVEEVPSPPKKKASKEEKIKTKRGIQLAAFAGINGASGLYNYKSGPEPPVPSLLPAPSIGINVDFPLFKAISMEATLSYRGKGDRIDMQDWFDSFELPPTDGVWEVAYPEADGIIQTYIGYGELALCPVFAFSESFRLGLGGYVAGGIHGKEKSDYTIDYYFEGEIFSREVINESRQIEFVELVSLQDTDEVRYINRLDYGFTAFMDIGQGPLSYRFTFNLGQESWEPENDLFGEGNQPQETYHLTGMFSLHYWFGK
jgi:hypothetical protein